MDNGDGSGMHKHRQQSGNGDGDKYNDGNGDIGNDFNVVMIISAALTQWLWSGTS